MRAISDVARDLELDARDVISYGTSKAKVRLEALARDTDRKGKLVLVSAVTPTKAGEGKTTVSVSLAMGLGRIGERVALCLREPSLGPVFGMKGGGTGGGRAQVVPSEEINLHFTGDIHAITSAHNLLSAMVDNDLYFGATSGLVPGGVTWPRVMDMNDRALRRVTLNGGKVPRPSHFDITAASEVMAVLCLSESLEDLRARLGRIVVGWTADDKPVSAQDLGAAEAMTVLLRDALCPNLVQTAEGGAAFVHGGPFANIAHGCSSVIATRMGLRYGDVVVTEAGFGFDLGGEKFLGLKCRQSGLWPSCVVLVATVRALVSHGGGGPEGLRAGLTHIDQHVGRVRAFGVEPVIAINVFASDSEADLHIVEQHCLRQGLAIGRCSGFSEGGAGAEALARVVMEKIRSAPPSNPRFLYELRTPFLDKLRAVAKTIYGASDVVLSDDAKAGLAMFERAGFAELPVCIAKTHLSLTDDPNGGVFPRSDTVLKVTSLRVAAGAGFIVALMGDIMTMPGLPREPAARRVRLAPDGTARGLMQNE